MPSPSSGIFGGYPSGIFGSFETSPKYRGDNYQRGVYEYVASGTITISGAAVTTTNLTISGVTKTNAGSILGSCKVFLLRDVGSGVFNFIAYTTSNSSTGVYTFTGLAGSASYMAIAWKDNTPHVFDATDYVLQPVGV
jgi:hypothetical protein